MYEQVSINELGEYVCKVEAIVNDLVSKLALATSPKAIIREPPIDVYDTGDYYVVLVDLPGVKKESIRVRVGQNYVEIYAEPQVEQVVGKAVKVERLSNFRLYRKVELEGRLRLEGARAVYRDGVLQITLPKAVVQPEGELSIE